MDGNFLDRQEILLSGENLIDAQPRLDSQTNQPNVSFTLDRLGAQKFGRATTDNVGKTIKQISDYQYKDSFVGDKEINVISMIFEILRDK